MAPRIHEISSSRKLWKVRVQMLLIVLLTITITSNVVTAIFPYCHNILIISTNIIIIPSSSSISLSSVIITISFITIIIITLDNVNYCKQHFICNFINFFVRDMPVVARMRLVIKEKGGFFGLYRGILPGSIRSFMSNGCSMIVMTFAQRKVSEWGLREKLG